MRSALNMLIFPNSMFTSFLYERATCSLEKLHLEITIIIIIIVLIKHPSLFYYHSTIHYTAVSTEAMRFMCLAQGHNILMQHGFEPSMAATIFRHSYHMTNMLQKDNLLVQITNNRLVQ